MATNFKGLVRGLKNVVVQYEEIEIKVREATSNDSWGATTTLMSEIAQATNDHKEYNKLFAMLWKRLKDEGNVLHVQKAMILIEYLLRNGSDRFIRDVKDRVDDIDRLRSYKTRSSKLNDVDRARQVRRKAAALITLVSDEKRLLRERQTAERIKNVKNTAVSSDGSHGGGVDRVYDGTVLPPKESPPARESKGTFEDDPFSSKKKKTADPFDDDDDADDDFDDDPFSPKKPKRKPKKQLSEDPFADDPFSKAGGGAKKQPSVDPFGDDGGTSGGGDIFDDAPPAKSKGRKAKSKKGRKKQQQQQQLFNPVNEPAPQASAAAADTGGSLSALFSVVDISGGGAGQAQQQQQQQQQPVFNKQASVDFLGGGGAAPTSPQAGKYGGFARQPTEKKQDSISNLVNFGNIMEPRTQPQQKQRTTMQNMQASNIDLPFGQPSQPPPQRKPQMTQGGQGTDVFFDQKGAGLEALFGGGSTAPAPQPQRPQYNPQIGYGGGFQPQGMMMQQQQRQQPMMMGMRQQPQPTMGYNPYMQQQQQQPMMGGGYQQQPPVSSSHNPFMQPPMMMTQQQPQQQQQQQQQKNDAFQGLSW